MCDARRTEIFVPKIGSYGGALKDMTWFSDREGHYIIEITKATLNQLTISIINQANVSKGRVFRRVGPKAFEGKRYDWVSTIKFDRDDTLFFSSRNTNVGWVITSNIFTFGTN